MSRLLLEAAAKNDRLLLEKVLNSEFGYLDVQDINDALLKAAQNGNSECVSRLLAEGADIDCDDCDGDTPLMLAATNNHTDVVKLLLDCECEMNLQSDRYRSALHMAVWSRSITAMYLLVEAGCKTNIQDMYGDTPLMLAAKKGDSEVVQFLLRQEGTQINTVSYEKDTVLHYAADSGDVECLKLVLSHKSNVVEAKNIWGYTPLLYSAMHGHDRATRALLESGADFSVRNQGELTVLHFCARKNLFSSLKCCLDLGADPNVLDSVDNTPLLSAVLYRHMKSIKLLITYGADVYLAGKNTIRGTYDYFTCLEMAVLHEDLDIAAVLLAVGAQYSRATTSHKDLLPSNDVTTWLNNSMASPMSLQNFCRCSLRQTLKMPIPRSIQELPLPTTLKAFLAFSEFEP